MVQRIGRSLRISRKAKNQAYGHYCNLCKKYNQDRVNYYNFKQTMIMQMEYKILHEKQERIKNIMS